MGAYLYRVQYKWERNVKGNGIKRNMDLLTRHYNIKLNKQTIVQKLCNE